MSRIVGGEHKLGAREKEELRKMLWQAGEFCGVRVITYAVMSNHFHVLIGVPEEEHIPDGELVRRYAVLYGESRSPWHPAPEVLEELLGENEEEGRRWRARLQARMGDVSAYMKTVKQRFSLWYNHTHGRFGTLWADRFKSVLIEGRTQALRTVAAYIDLNPVRAGLAQDPADYRWCGYAEAMGGNTRAREGLARVIGGQKQEWAASVASYRRVLFGVGVSGTLEAGKIPRERALAVIAEGGEVPLAEALRCRVRYFSDGGVLGSEAFVRHWAKTRGVGHGRGERKRAPHSMKGADWGGLVVGRGLRTEVFT
jgi:putative transposase